MKRMIPLLLSLLLLAGCGGNSPAGASWLLSPVAAKEMMGTQEIIILVGREQDGKDLSLTHI